MKQLFLVIGLSLTVFFLSAILGLWVLRMMEDAPGVEMENEEQVSVVVEDEQNTNTERRREPENSREEGLKESEENEVPRDIPEEIIDTNIPFTSQAPLAQWEDPVFQNGCEEATLLMADRFARGDEMPFNAQEASQNIQELALRGEVLFGEHRDLSEEDTATLAREFFGLDVRVEENVSIEDMKRVMGEGKIALAPVNGTLLDNPYFTPPGPVYHMLLIRGYDPQTDEFITNDPGTRNGEGYRYDTRTLYDAMHTYETGYHGPVYPEQKTILVVAPNSITQE